MHIYFDEMMHSAATATVVSIKDTHNRNADNKEIWIQDVQKFSYQLFSFGYMCAGKMLQQILLRSGKTMRIATNSPTQRNRHTFLIQKIYKISIILQLSMFYIAIFIV